MNKFHIGDLIVNTKLNIALKSTDIYEVVNLPRNESLDAYEVISLRYGSKSYFDVRDLRLAEPEELI